MFSFTMLPVMDMFLVMMMTIWLNCSSEKRMNRLITLNLPEEKVFETEVNESYFFNFETRMRISPIQSCTLRRDENFWTLDLRLRDEIEKKPPSISGIEKRFIIFILRLRDENENSFDLISVFKTRSRVLSC